MWCDFLCCVMSRNALRCHVMSSHVMSCHLLWSDAVQWDEIFWVCDALWLFAMSRCVVRNGCVGWIGRWSGDPNYTDLLRTTQYYKVLLRYYSVLHSTTPVLLCTTKYYSSTTSVLQSTTPVLLCTRKYYSSTTPYYKVLLQYYAVLQSTTPVLFCTTKYYSSTTQYYKELLQYHSVLQRTTPVLVCTTKYYSSTTLYYKVLLQYYSVLQSTTPVLVCTTKYYSSTTLYYRTTPALLCTTKYYSSTNSVLYYKVLLQHYSLYYRVRICKARSTNVTKLMLCLPRKVTLMIDPRHIWNVIYNAQSNRTHPPTSPNTAPATQNDSHEWCPSHMKRHLQCAEQQVSSTNVTKYCACHEKWLASLILVTRETSFTICGTTGITLQPHQMLCLPRKMTRIIDPRDIWNVIYNARSNRHHPPTSPNTAPAPQNDSHDWCPSHMTRHLQCAEQQISSSHHQVLRLPRKMTRIIYPRDIWNVIYNARRNRHHPPTSPNTAPATQNDSHDWSSSHMKRHLQCAEQQASPSNLTKYCACHAKLHSKIKEKFAENSWSVNSNARPIRPWSEHDPNMIRAWTRHLAPARSPRLLFALRRFCIENYNISRSGYLLKFHRILRLPRKLTFQDHQILRLPRKMTLMIDVRHTWHVIYNARSNRSHPPTSPNAAPATQNDSHHLSS